MKLKSPFFIPINMTNEEIFWGKLNDKLSNDKWQYVDYYGLQSFLRNKQDLVVVDVSGEDNSKYFHHPKIDYLNISLKVIIDSLTKLKNQNKMIICVCAGGPKSAVAAQILRFKGMDAYYLSGGIEAIAKQPQSI